MFCVCNLDDKIGLDTLRDHSLCEVVLLDPDPTLCHVGSVIRWYSFGAVDDAPHFTGFERVFHLNRPDIIVLLVLEPVHFSFRKNMRQRG